MPAHHHDRATHDHHATREHDIIDFAYVLHDDNDHAFRIVFDGAFDNDDLATGLDELVRHPDVIAAYHRVHDRGDRDGHGAGGDLDDLRRDFVDALARRLVRPHALADVVPRDCARELLDALDAARNRR